MANLLKQAREFGERGDLEVNGDFSRGHSFVRAAMSLSGDPNGTDTASGSTADVGVELIPDE